MSYSVFIFFQNKIKLQIAEIGSMVPAPLPPPPALFFKIIIYLFIYLSIYNLSIYLIIFKFLLPIQALKWFHMKGFQAVKISPAVCCVPHYQVLKT